jgi:hypothetical protein
MATMTDLFERHWNVLTRCPLYVAIERRRTAAAVANPRVMWIRFSIYSGYVRGASDCAKD